jgi:hypothetical protein
VTAPPTEPSADYERWPVYWFARLEMAVEAGDHRAAARAQRRLARLGVRVNYGRPRPAEGVRHVG